jgi:lysophospholipase L1-like esterase
MQAIKKTATARAAILFIPNNVPYPSVAVNSGVFPRGISGRAGRLGSVAGAVSPAFFLMPKAGKTEREELKSDIMRAFRPAAILFIVLALAACSRGERSAGGVIVLCVGDSITELGYSRYLAREFRKEGIRARVLNYGRSGNTSAEYLRWLRNGADRKLRRERPDFILVELGTNDVRMDGDRVSRVAFAENMRKIISILRGFRTRSGNRPAILVAAIPPIPEGTPYPFGPESIRRVDEEINPEIRKLCLEMGIPPVDNHALFSASPGLLPGVHPSPDGYRAMAANWAAAVRRLREKR